MPLKGKIALVTGASRGIGRGIALQLGTAGATVYVTGRQPSKRPTDLASDLPSLEQTANEVTQRGGKGIAVYCDHSNPDDVKKLFARIENDEKGRLDILVNNAYAGVPAILDNMGKKFWELEPLIWDDINNVGLRNHYVCSVYAARLMVPRKSGLIVNVSSAGGLKYIFNVAYGVGKEACDRMAADCAQELRPHNVAFVSLWPGAVKTELIMNTMQSPKGAENPGMTKMFEEGETIEYSGKCVVHLAADPTIMNRTGKILLTGDLGDHYSFVDVNGHKPRSIRSLKTLLEYGNYKRTAAWVPEWMKLPGWMLSMGGNKM